MFAELDLVWEGDAERLPPGTHWICTVAPRDSGQVDTSLAADKGLTLQSLRMPFTVTEDRVFGHRAYWVEHDGRPFPFQTELAWCREQEIFSFL
jgi:hypothetical protein